MIGRVPAGPDLRDWVTKRGGEPMSMTQPEFARFVQAESKGAPRLTNAVEIKPRTNPWAQGLTVNAMEAALTRTPLRGEAHNTYRKILNLRPMQDVGTMSARKFTSSPHEFTMIWWNAMTQS